MAAKRTRGDRCGGEVTIQLSVLGLVLFCVAGLLALGFITVRSDEHNSAPGLQAINAAASPDADVPPAEVPPWGELITSDIELEQPEEYADYAIDTNQTSSWTFSGMTAGQVKDLLQSCGLTPLQVGHALSPGLASFTPSNTVIKPDDELVLSLSPPTKAKLYLELARDPANSDRRFPVCYTRRSFDTWFKDIQVDDAAGALLRGLMYPRGDYFCFSDYGVLWRHVPSEADRFELVKAISRQPAVLVRLRIRQDTDIDKVLDYWGRGLNDRDVRPLLESLKQLHDGGSVNLIHLLPQFARQRLYTFPQPSKPGDPVMDCHWSSMNYFNEIPDNRFGDPAYTSAYANTNYYQVNRATHYGDMFFFFDGPDSVIHSAVYLADDIVFTKNGNNYAQPWKLMRLKDLAARFTADAPPRVVVYRTRKSS